MAYRTPSFANNWVLYASLKSAQKGRVFSGQKQFLASLNKNLKSISAPRSSFGRQLRLLQALRRKPQSTQALCRALKVSRRTLFRDLATIRNAGIDIESDGQCFELSAKQLRSTLGQTL
jgi:biotin operon repressor